MTAAVLYGKEDVKIERVPIPHVENGELLVKVQVALTCGTDLKVYERGYHARMIVPPALFGHELAGTIEQVGEGVRGFKKGMRVVALNSAPCGMCFYCSKHQGNLCEDLLFNNGAYAEYIRIPRRIVETNMLVVPSHVSFEDAAMTEPLACVLRGLHETGVEMVRKGGTVNFFGGCASGTKVQLDTNRLHYSEITLKATFHHTPETVRRAFALIAEKKIRSTDYITGEAPLSRLQQVLRHMLNRNGDIKTAIIPGH